jgi:hypothetical protein
MTDTDDPDRWREAWEGQGVDEEELDEEEERREEADDPT